MLKEHQDQALYFQLRYQDLSKKFMHCLSKATCANNKNYLEDCQEAFYIAVQFETLLSEKFEFDKALIKYQVTQLIKSREERKDDI